jgi:hypothetical protein
MGTGFCRGEKGRDELCRESDHRGENVERLLEPDHPVAPVRGGNHGVVRSDSVQGRGGVPGGDGLLRPLLLPLRPDRIHAEPPPAQQAGLLNDKGTVWRRQMDQPG